MGVHKSAVRMMRKACRATEQSESITMGQKVMAFSGLAFSPWIHDTPTHNLADDSVACLEGVKETASRAKLAPNAFASNRDQGGGLLGGKISSLCFSWTGQPLPKDAAYRGEKTRGRQLPLLTRTRGSFLNASFANNVGTHYCARSCRSLVRRASSWC